MRGRAALAAILAIPLAAAAPQGEPSLDWLHGEWAGSGTLQGQPTIVTLSVSPVFGAKAAALSYRAQMPAASFEGRATYHIKAKGRVEGQWSDSMGSLHPIGGRIEGTAMTTVWGSPMTELGRSTYTLDTGGALTVTDSVLTEDGSWRLFAKAVYRRKS